MRSSVACIAIGAIVALGTPVFGQGTGTTGTGTGTTGTGTTGTGATGTNTGDLQGGGTVNANNGLNLPGLTGLQNNLSSGDDIFQDNRRVTGQTSGGDGQTGGGGGALGSLFGGGGGGGGLFGQLLGGGGNAPSTGRRVLRAPLRADFDVTRPLESEISRGIQGRLVHIRPLEPVAETIRVEVVDRVATIRGSVATARQKDLAERITRLEPGISEVRNELIIVPN